MSTSPSVSCLLCVGSSALVSSEPKSKTQSHMTVRHQVPPLLPRGPKHYAFRDRASPNGGNTVLPRQRLVAGPGLFARGVSEESSRRGREPLHHDAESRSASSIFPDV